MNQEDGSTDDDAQKMNGMAPSDTAPPPKSKPVSSRQFRRTATPATTKPAPAKNGLRPDIKLHKRPLVRDFRRRLAWDAKIRSGAKDEYADMAFAYLSSIFQQGSQLLHYRNHKRLTTRELDYIASQRGAGVSGAEQPNHIVYNKKT